MKQIFGRKEVRIKGELVNIITPNFQLNGAPLSSGISSVGTIGPTNANGATIDGSSLRLAPASATTAGILTNASQSIQGTKTFVNGAAFSSTGATLNTYTTTTFTTGGDAEAKTIQLQKIGNIVTLSWPQTLFGVTPADYAAGIGTVPVGYRPPSDVYVPVVLGATYTSTEPKLNAPYISISPSGSLIITTGDVTVTFEDSAECTLYGGSATYSIV